MPDTDLPFSAASPARDAVSPLPPSTVVINRRIATWDEHGNPIATTVPLITKTQLVDLYMAAAAQPYVVEDPLDPEYGLYDGLSCGEVMVKKQIATAARTGDSSLIETIMDRILGRPRQTVESTQLKLTYEDTLKEIARKEQMKTSSSVFDSP